MSLDAVLRRPSSKSTRGGGVQESPRHPLYSLAVTEFGALGGLAMAF
jgi:hypothetical protein